MEQLHGVDAAFLYLETPTTHMHVVGSVLLEGSLRGGTPREALEQVLLERLHLLAPLRRRLVTVPGRFSHPYWIEDPDFDLDRHLHGVTLRPPGGRAELEAFVAEVASVPLDRRFPLWQMFVVDGLADGRTALVSKFHHATMDGGAGSEMLATMFELSPEGGSLPPPRDAWAPDRIPGRAELVARGTAARTRDLASAPAALLRAGRGLVGAATQARRRSDDEGEVGIPLTAPQTPFNGAISARRSVAMTECDFDDLRAAREAHEVTINDVVLAAAASSLRGYLLAREALPERPLLVSVPVSTRTATQREEMGNRVSTLLVPLPVAIEDPVERLQAIHANTRLAKDAHETMGPQMLQEFTGLAPPNLLTGGARIYSRLGLARFHAPAINLVVSNVAGPPFPLFIAGATVVGVYPMGPLIEGSGLNLTVLSRVGKLDIGVIADAALLPEPREVADAFVTGVRELLPRRRRRAPKASTA